MDMGDHRRMSSPTPQPQDLFDLAQALLAAARSHHQRRLLVLSGEAEWCRARARSIARALALAPALWLGEPDPQWGQESLPMRDGRRLLGRELQLLVADAHAGFDADGFGAASGALVGGGLLLLLTPPQATWPQQADPEALRLLPAGYSPEELGNRFVRHLSRMIEQDPHKLHVHQGQALPSLPAPPAMGKAAPPAPLPCRTADQAAAVEAILHVVHGHRRRPLVLTADRGRGKTSALGIAAARLLEQGRGRIVVTAPRAAAVAPLFERAQALLSGAEKHGNRLVFEEAELCFIPPDELQRERPEADLLLVDEAAAIPAPLLNDFLQHHARIVFATTVHGYEGTGRGFALRFRRRLDELTPQWREFKLQSPIRWAANDPLEAFVFRALLLDTEPATPETSPQQSPVYARLDREWLLENPQQLRQLFGLLVLAHYRTSPNDLRQLLDAPNLQVHVLHREKNIVAVALVAEEGGLSDALAQAIYAGRRRPQGHLLPQTLTAHAGLPQAATLRMTRIMRIAVHPELHRQGLGSRLLQDILRASPRGSFAGVGASFGASPELLAFWRENGFLPVWMGLSRDHASGTHAAVVLRPLSQSGEALLQQARQRLAARIADLLAGPLNDLEPQVALALLRELPLPEADLSALDRQEVAGFALGLRGYEFSLTPLRRLALSALVSGQADKKLAPPQQALLLAKVLQGKDEQSLCRLLGLQGRRQIIETLRQSFAALLDHN